MKCNEPRTTCPSREEFAKELFNSLGGCVIKETTGYTIYDRWVMKFGKDNSEFGHSGDITVSSYPEDNHQPPKEQICSCGNRYAGEPKERKVSLEEIADYLVKWTLENKATELKQLTYDGFTLIAKAILSLLNAKESTEKEIV